MKIKTIAARGGWLLLAWTATMMTAACAKDGGLHARHSPYAGEENRRIKSLSAEDVAELKRGGGWGLAKAAELNGLPGPAHLLEMRREIALTENQFKAIEKIHREMQAQAIAHGAEYLALEAKLEAKFRRGGVGEAELAALLEDIGRARARLRHAHLNAHLLAAKTLSARQIHRYNALRGYHQADPCAAGAPQGHDPALWRKHNGCE